MIMATTEPQAPKIEFPCVDYPVKIIGTNCDEFVDVVLEVVCRHCPDFDQKYEQIPSSNGRFVSLRVCITAEGEQQLSSLHQDLRATGMVHMVL